MTLIFFNIHQRQVISLHEKDINHIKNYSSFLFETFPFIRFSFPRDCSDTARASYYRSLDYRVVDYCSHAFLFFSMIVGTFLIIYFYFLILKILQIFFFNLMGYKSMKSLQHERYFSFLWLWQNSREFSQKIC